MVRDVLPLGRVAQHLGDPGVGVGAAGDAGPPASSAGDATGPGAGVVGSDGHVDGQADFRLQGATGGLGPAQPDLLLYGARDVEGDCEVVCGAEPQGLQGDEQPGLVVQAGGRHEVVGRLRDAQPEREVVARPDAPFRVRLVPRPDVDPHVVQERHLLLFLFRL